MAISKNGVPYFKEVQICRKPEILVLRKTALAKVGIPYFEDSRFSKKPSFLTIRIARFLKSQNPYGKDFRLLLRLSLSKPPVIGELVSESFS